jgi:dihydrofolate reductase
MINLIAAVDLHRGIGINGQLPWRLKEDMNRFRRLTMGTSVIMGRKTWDSLPPVYRPLPSRQNIVLSRQPLVLPATLVVGSVKAALEAAVKKEIFVIGGGEVYGLFLPYAERIYLTEVDTDAAADTFFPDFDGPSWRRQIEGRRHDEAADLHYLFAVYERVGNAVQP